MAEIRIESNNVYVPVLGIDSGWDHFYLNYGDSLLINLPELR